VTQAFGKLRASLAVVALCAPVPSFAQGAAPYLWPVRGLYGLEQGACSQAQGSPTAMVDPALCGALGDAQRQAIGQHFAALMKQAFPAVEERFAEHLPPSATPRARLAGTLVATLTLSRATIWTVNKPTSVDAYLPITLTLAITNAATGEVVFSRSRSDISQGTFPPETAQADVVAQFPAKLNATLETLVHDAAIAWKPYDQQANVVADVALGGQSKGWIINHGRDRGFRAGDAIGDDGRVLYAGPTYAVVQPTLGTYRIGQSLGRIAAAPAAMLARPSVLVSFDRIPDGYAASYLSTILEEQIGDTGAFAPMPINAGFVNLRRQALGEAQAVAMEDRSLPDLVASVSVVALPTATIPTQLNDIVLERFEAHAFLSLVDRTGRVVASFHGVNAITDKVAVGIKFTGSQRRDTVIRNALVDVAEKMKAYKPQPALIPVASTGNGFVLRDAGGAVPLGAEFPVLRTMGKVSGIEGTVRVPIGRVRSTQLVEGGLSAQNVDITNFTAREGDVIALEAVGLPLLARQPYAQCVDETGQGLVRSLTPTTITGWPEAATGVLAASFPAPVHIVNLPARLASLKPDFAGWDQFLPGRAITPGICFAAIQSVQANGAAYDVALGYLLRKGSEKVGASGMGITLTPAKLPTSIAPQDADALLQSDLILRGLPVAEKAAAGLKPVAQN